MAAKLPKNYLRPDSVTFPKDLGSDLTVGRYHPRRRWMACVHPA